MDFISGLRRKISNPRAKVKRICLETGCVKKLRKLIRLNADLNIEKMRFDGITSLQLSVSSGYLHVAKFLVEECGADVNEFSDTGFTALHVACDRDMVDMANYLVHKGARLDAKDAKGRTPLDVCGSIGLDKLPDSAKKSRPGNEVCSSDASGKLSTSSVAETLEIVSDDQSSRSITPTTEQSDASESGISVISKLDPVDCSMSFRSTVTSPSLLSVHQKIADLNMRSGRQPMPESLLSAIRQPTRKSTSSSRYHKQYEATCHEHETMSIRSSSNSQILVGPLSFNDDSRSTSITSEDNKYKGHMMLWERLQEDEERVSGEQKSGQDSLRANSVKSYLQSKTSQNVPKFSPKAAPPATTQSANDMKWGGKGDRRGDVQKIDRDRFRFGRDKSGDDGIAVTKQSLFKGSTREVDRYIKGQVQLSIVSVSEDSSGSDSDHADDDFAATAAANVLPLSNRSSVETYRGGALRVRFRAANISEDSSDSDEDQLDVTADSTTTTTVCAPPLNMDRSEAYDEVKEHGTLGADSDSEDNSDNDEDDDHADVDVPPSAALTPPVRDTHLSNEDRQGTCKNQSRSVTFTDDGDSESDSDSDDGCVNFAAASPLLSSASNRDGGQSNRLDGLRDRGRNVTFTENNSDSDGDDNSDHDDNSYGSEDNIGDISVSLADYEQSQSIMDKGARDGEERGQCLGAIDFENEGEGNYDSDEGNADDDDHLAAEIAVVMSLSNEHERGHERIRATGISEDSSDSDGDDVDVSSVTAIAATVPSRSNGSRTETYRGGIRDRLRATSISEDSNDGDGDHVDTAATASAATVSAPLQSRMSRSDASNRFVDRGLAGAVGISIDSSGSDVDGHGDDINDDGGDSEYDDGEDEDGNDYDVGAAALPPSNETRYEEERGEGGHETEDICNAGAVCSGSGDDVAAVAAAIQSTMSSEDLEAPVGNEEEISFYDFTSSNAEIVLDSPNGVQAIKVMPNPTISFDAVYKAVSPPVCRFKESMGRSAATPPTVEDAPVPPVTDNPKLQKKGVIGGVSTNRSDTGTSSRLPSISSVVPASGSDIPAFSMSSSSSSSYQAAALSIITDRSLVGATDSFLEVLARHELIAFAAASSPYFSAASSLGCSPFVISTSPSAATKHTHSQFSLVKEKKKTLSYIVHTAGSHDCDSDGESISSGWSWAAARGPAQIEAILGLENSDSPPYEGLDKSPLRAVSPAAELLRGIAREVEGLHDTTEPLSADSDCHSSSQENVHVSADKDDENSRTVSSDTAQNRDSPKKGTHTAQAVTDISVHSDRSRLSPLPESYSDVEEEEEEEEEDGSSPDGFHYEEEEVEEEVRAAPVGHQSLRSTPTIIQSDLLASHHRQRVRRSYESVTEVHHTESESDVIIKSERVCAAPPPLPVSAKEEIAIEERNALLERIALLERKSLVLEQSATDALATAAVAVSQLQEEKVKRLDDVLTLLEDARNLTLKQEHDYATLADQLTTARSILAQAGEDAKVSASARLDLELRASTAISKLEERLKAEESSRLLAEEKLKCIEIVSNSIPLVKFNTKCDSVGTRSSKFHVSTSTNPQLPVTSVPSLKAPASKASSPVSLLPRERYQGKGGGEHGTFLPLQHPERAAGGEELEQGAHADIGVGVNVVPAVVTVEVVAERAEIGTVRDRDLDKESLLSEGDTVGVRLLDGKRKSAPSSQKSDSSDVTLSFDDIYPTAESKCKGEEVTSIRDVNFESDVNDLEAEWQAFEVNCPRYRAGGVRSVSPVILPSTGLAVETRRGLNDLKGDGEDYVDGDIECTKHLRKSSSLERLLFIEDNPLLTEPKRISLNKKKEEDQKDCNGQTLGPHSTSTKQEFAEMLDLDFENIYAVPLSCPMPSTGKGPETRRGQKEAKKINDKKVLYAIEEMSTIGEFVPESGPGFSKIDRQYFTEENPSLTVSGKSPERRGQLKKKWTISKESSNGQNIATQAVIDVLPDPPHTSSLSLLDIDDLLMDHGNSLLSSPIHITKECESEKEKEFDRGRKSPKSPKSPIILPNTTLEEGSPLLALIREHGDKFKDLGSKSSPSKVIFNDPKNGVLLSGLMNSDYSNVGFSGIGLPTPMKSEHKHDSPSRSPTKAKSPGKNIDFEEEDSVDAGRTFSLDGLLALGHKSCTFNVAGVPLTATHEKEVQNNDHSSKSMDLLSCTEDDPFLTLSRKSPERRGQMKKEVVRGKKEEVVSADVSLTHGSESEGDLSTLVFEEDPFRPRSRLAQDLLDAPEVKGRVDLRVEVEEKEREVEIEVERVVERQGQGGIDLDQIAAEESYMMLAAEGRCLSPVDGYRCVIDRMHGFFEDDEDDTYSFIDALSPRSALAAATGTLSALDTNRDDDVYVESPIVPQNLFAGSSGSDDTDVEGAATITPRADQDNHHNREGAVVPFRRADQDKHTSRVERVIMLKLDWSLTAICSVVSKMMEAKRHEKRSSSQHSPHLLSQQSPEDMKAEAWRRLKAHFNPVSALLSLGPIPAQIVPLIKANESPLKGIFRRYCTAKTKSKGSVIQDESTAGGLKCRMLSIAHTWDLFIDFNIHQDANTIVDLASAIAAVTQNPLITSSYQSRTQPVLSFRRFLQLLWHVAVYSPLEPVTATPRSRLLSLLGRVDSSSGRALQYKKDMSEIPPFKLTEFSSRNLALKILNHT